MLKKKEEGKKELKRYYQLLDHFIGDMENFKLNLLLNYIKMF